MGTKEKSFPGRQNTLRTGFSQGSCLVDLRNSKKASVAGGQCAKGGRMGDRARVVNGAV